MSPLSERPPNAERIRRGVKGPSFETLIKVLDKGVHKRAMETHQLSPSEAQEHVLRKRFELDNRVLSKYALDAADLDPKDPKERKVRDRVHGLMKQHANLVYDTEVDPELKYDPERHMQREMAIHEALMTILVAKGPEALKRFSDAINEHQISLGIAHSEVSKRLRGERRRSQ